MLNQVDKSFALLAPQSTVKSDAATMAGAVTSFTVMIAVSVSVLLLLSVTVRVTVLAPKSAHVKAVLSKASVAMPQASDEPLSTSAGVMEPLPEASRFTVRFCVTATGSTWSRTKTFAVAVLSLPHSSVTVKVTVLLPTSLQSNDVMSSDKVTSPHVSEEPLSMSAVVIEAAPLASKSTVMSSAEAVGAVVSLMVRMRDVVEAFPQSSVAVNVTMAEPVLPQPLVMPV